MVYNSGQVSHENHILVLLYLKVLNYVQTVKCALHGEYMLQAFWQLRTTIYFIVFIFVFILAVTLYHVLEAFWLTSR